MDNLHKSYYKDYFKGINFGYLLNGSDEPENAEITRKNKAFTDNSHSYRDNREWKLKGEYLIKNEVFPNDDDSIISLKVSYPGLMTGIGISHKAEIKGEFKLGMHFDWTYGMPVIYGSSVKGVLRAWFKEFYKGNRDVYDYEKELFEGALRDVAAEEKKYGREREQKVKDTENRIYVFKSIYNRDIFFDAVITAPDTQGRILCSDSITPHGDNPLKNPKPITFVKIAPGCELIFRFTFTGSKEEKKEKKELFKEILTTVGIGAKTNVGYGQLKEA